jgi:cysteinyl-tRNA synthetase
MAQSCCAHDGKEFVRYWMHNAYVNIDGEKMSKSLGNFRMVNDLLEHYPGEVLRFALLSAHYRSELNFSADVLDAARKTLDNLYGILRSVADVEVDMAVDVQQTAVYQALLDDLNTPIAIRELHGLAKAMKDAQGQEQVRLKSLLLKAASLMGLLQQPVNDWFYVKLSDSDMSDDQVEQRVEDMLQARKDKNYTLADQIRDELLGAGISLTRDGWKRG